MATVADGVVESTIGPECFINRELSWLVRLGWLPGDQAFSRRLTM